MIALCIIDDLKVVSGFLTPLIAILAVYIAYQQYYINKQKLKLDLYEKRYRIFDETKKILLKINQEAKIDTIELRDFMFSTNDRIFLFEPEINQFIMDIKEKAIALNSSEANLRAQFSSDERAEQAAKNSMLTKWFSFEYENIEKRFLKYLDFKEL